MTPTEATQIIKVGADLRLRQIRAAELSALLDVEHSDMTDALKAACDEKKMERKGRFGSAHYIIGQIETLPTASDPVKYCNDVETWGTALERAGYEVTRPEAKVRPCLKCGSEFVTHRQSYVQPLQSPRRGSWHGLCGVGMSNRLTEEEEQLLEFAKEYLRLWMTPGVPSENYRKRMMPVLAACHNDRKRFPRREKLKAEGVI